jgi:hypothetical protein
MARARLSVSGERREESGDRMGIGFYLYCNSSTISTGIAFVNESARATARAASTTLFFPRGRRSPASFP